MHLSIQAIISQAIQSIRENLGFFMGITLLFFGLTALLEGVFLLARTSNFLVVFLLAIIGFAFYVKQAVVIHRSVILDEAKRWDRVFSWGSPDNQFLLICIGLWVLFYLSAAIITGVMAIFLIDGNSKPESIEGFYLIVIPLMLIAGAIFARICLVLPSRAVGESMSLEKSFALTKGNGLKIFVLIVLLPIASNLLLSELLSEDILIYNLFIGLIAHLVVVFQVSVLSHTFMAITENKGTEEQTQLDI